MQKKSSFFSILFFLVSLLPLSALENSLLWRVSGNDLKEPSYLFGTMHMLCADDFKVTDKVLTAFGNTNTLVLELNPTDPGLMAEMQQLAVNPGFENIYTDIPAEEYAAINSALMQNFGAGLDQLGVMKPFTLTAMLMMALFPCEDLKSYEVFFVEKADAGEKEIISLETAAFQIGIFDAIPVEFQIRELVRILGEEGNKELEGMTKAYLSEDLSQLMEIMVSNDMMNEWSNLILDKRNQKWARELPAIMSENSAFIAVGAGHLPGNQGVIELLRKAGYNVEPVF